jgi:hypothetical protein
MSGIQAPQQPEPQQPEPKRRCCGAIVDQLQFMGLA